MPEKAQNARKEMEKTHKTIVALGGGEIKSKTTLKIDEYVASLAYKRAGGRRPAGLFLGTASHDSMPYFNSFRKTYTSVFDIKADVALTVYGEMDLPHIEEKFLKADFLYIGQQFLTVFYGRVSENRSVINAARASCCWLKSSMPRAYRSRSDCSFIE